jgi:predicted helicase
MLLPLADKRTKCPLVAGQERAIFKLYSRISTNRDEWLYGRDENNLAKKVRCFLQLYDRVSPAVTDFPDTIKWSETLKRRKRAGKRRGFETARVRRAAYRPFLNILLYQSPLLVDRPGLSEAVFPPGRENFAICFNDVGSRTDYCVLAVPNLADLHFVAAVDAYQQAPRYSYSNGQRMDNITDWALGQFRDHYADTGRKRPISKDAIFQSVYAVLQDPIYRETYALNLKKEFPRMPFYANFLRWAEWGKRLWRCTSATRPSSPGPCAESTRRTRARARPAWHRGRY